MVAFIDLHLHTRCSDGTAAPEELLELVRMSDVKAFAVTDHDTLGGYRAVKGMLSERDPELVPGVELSVEVEDGDMHLLAYLIDPEHEGLRDALSEFQKRRNERGKIMVDKLNKLGIDIAFADVEAQAGGSVIGRPHVARAMFEKKAIKYYEEAFRSYIGFGGPAYVPKQNFSPEEAIKIVHEAGGLAVLAHPGVDDKGRYIETLVGMGLDGLEAYHPSHKQSEVDRFKHLAQRHRLVVTGGSDYHGIEDRYGRVGSQNVPYQCLEDMKAKKK